MRECCEGEMLDNVTTTLGPLLRIVEETFFLDISSFRFVAQFFAAIGSLKYCERCVISTNDEL